MSVLPKKIESKLFSNTLWIYLTLLLFVSYLLLILVDVQSLSKFIEYFGGLSIVFLPVLLFATWRKIFQEKLAFMLFGSLWLYCFVIHPLILIKWGGDFVEEFLIISSLKESILNAKEFLLTIAGAILLTEVALQFNKRKLDQIKEMNWLKRLSFEESLLLLILLISIVRAAFFCVNQVFQEEYISLGLVAKTVFKFFSFSIQLFLISLVYYFFYYANRYFLIPRILKQKGIIYYGFSIAAIILLCYPIFIFLIRLLPVVYEMNLINYIPNDKLFASDSGGGPFIIIILSLPVIISIEWFRQTSEISNLEKEKSITELSFLKQQINPHFFFNTLNNLYAMSITKDPKTPEVILQLSELMRYVIYKGKEKETLLKEEVKYIEDYIELQRIRLHKKMEYQFVKNIDNENLRIPPLLFIVLVENAFKHGIEPAEQNCFLHMELTSKENRLVFICENSFEEKEKETIGIGLNNLKRRLALSFPNRHELKIIKMKNNFKASLEIELMQLP